MLDNVCGAYLDELRTLLVGGANRTGFCTVLHEVQRCNTNGTDFRACMAPYVDRVRASCSDLT